jgi:hypothetical protein
MRNEREITSLSLNVENQHNKGLHYTCFFYPIWLKTLLLSSMASMFGFDAHIATKLYIVENQ